MLYSFYIVVFHSAKVNHAQCIAALGQSTGQERWHKETLPSTHTQEETTSGQGNDTMRHVWWPERQGAERKSNDGGVGVARVGPRQQAMLSEEVKFNLSIAGCAGTSQVSGWEGFPRGGSPVQRAWAWYSVYLWRAVSRMKLEGEGTDKTWPVL